MSPYVESHCVESGSRAREDLFVKCKWEQDIKQWSAMNTGQKIRGRILE